MANVKTELLNDGQIAIVSINKPKKFNSLTWDNFIELQKEVEKLGVPGSTVRCIILKGEGKHFTSGLDLQSAMKLQDIKQVNADPARAAFHMHGMVKPLQDAVSVFEKVRVPVIACIHGYCIGAGVDLASSCDIRVCSKDSQFTIKEVDIGLAADIGTLQRFQKVVGNESWARELAYTARMFSADEALQRGFVSSVFENAQETYDAALKLA
jgi:enoyl-CoA hydratase/carnithine racemase